MKCFIQNMNIEYISHLIKQFHFTAVLIFVFLHYQNILSKNTNNDIIIKIIVSKSDKLLI